ncbi:MAG: redoxin domain-containing protein [Planctomycetes bacterium]|jgi:hypothetical protein|nr:redoxin domain-containing protein [Planctomycetota bacterium]
MTCILWVALAATLPLGCGDSEGTTGEEDASRKAFLRDYALAGKVVLMEFGHVGCEVSDRGLRAMMDLQRSGAIPGLIYTRVEIATDEQAVGEYYRELDPTLKIIRDPDRQIMSAFDARAIPTFVLLDRFGRVRYRGGVPTGELYEWVAVLQKETDDPGPDAPQFGKVELAGPTLLKQTALPALNVEARPLESYRDAGGLVAVVIDTQCPFAATAREEMATVAAGLAAHNVSSVLINVNEPADIVRQFYHDKNLTVPLLYDGSGQILLRWDIDSVPTVVYFGADGGIQYKGEALWAALASAVGEALGLPPGTVSFAAKGTEYG